MSYETNSKLIKKGDTFVAIKGVHFDGHDYINEAIQNGATKIIGEKVLNIKGYQKVKSTQHYLTRKVTKLNKKLSKNFTIIGITGTKGKSTTAMTTYQILKNLNYKVAYIGTLGLYFNDKVLELNNTTPDILTLNKILTILKDNNITHILMEVSSHALIEKRINGINFDIAAFTNLSQDHLDFHHTMEEYLNAKLKILKYTKGPIILNSNVKESISFMKKTNKYITFGTGNDDYKIIKENNNANNSILVFGHDYNTYSVAIPLPCHYNVLNYMLAIIICHNLGISINDIINITNNIKPIKGRNELIESKKRFIVIDYAHSPASVEETLKNYQNIKKGNLYTIIGCGGNRDKTKRPIMAKIACNNSDYVIFTSDNPRDENPNNILNDMLYGMDESNYEVIPDRRKAIKKGIKLLKEDDYLLILGKGHENYQLIQNKKLHFDDKEEALKFLN